MSTYRLQIFEPCKKDWSDKYHFAFIASNNFKGYPANFICLLPRRIFESGKPVSEFGRLFGEKSSEFAIELLTEAIIQEKDNKVKAELEKRKKTFELAKPKLICGSCHKEFEEYSRMKYKHRLCKKCLVIKFLQN